MVKVDELDRTRVCVQIPLELAQQWATATRENQGMGLFPVYVGDHKIGDFMLTFVEATTSWRGNSVTYWGTFAQVAP
jgi:hypothetical protein